MDKSFIIMLSSDENRNDILVNKHTKVSSVALLDTQHNFFSYLLKSKFSSCFGIFLKNSPDVETIDPIQLRTHLTHIASMGNYLPEVSLG